MTDNNRATPFSIKLADTVIRIEPMFEYIREYCRDYITEEQASFTVRTEPGDIAFERESSAKEAQDGCPVNAIENAEIKNRSPFGLLFSFDK